MDISGIIKQLAEKHNMTLGAVKLIVDSQFSFIHQMMMSRQLKSIMIHHFGKIAIKPNRLKLLDDRKKRIEEWKIRTNNRRLEESNVQVSTNRTDSSQESGNLLPVSVQ